MNRFLILSFSCLLGLSQTAYAETWKRLANQDIPYPTKTQATPGVNQTISNKKIQSEGPRPGFVGYYLAARHAQMQGDWTAASTYLDLVAAKDPDNLRIQRRAMVVSAGGGNLELAVHYADQILETQPRDALSNLFMATHAMETRQYAKARTALMQMDEGGMKKFVVPLMQAWLSTAKGNLNFSHLSATSLNAYHAALMANLLDQQDRAMEFIKKIHKNPDVQASLKLADALVLAGDKEAAKELYQKLQVSLEDKQILRKRLKAMKDGALTSYLRRQSPQKIEDGFALAFLDLARVLYVQNSQDSSRVFLQLGLSLDPKLEEGIILMAQIFEETENPQLAIKTYRKLPKTSYYYTNAQLEIARLLEKSGQPEAAIARLEELFSETHELNVLIQLADTLRRHNQPAMAEEAYTKAIRSFAQGVPEQHWHLFYSRGITHDQIGDWAAAEQDFKTALTYRPNNSFVLNYLGFGWAERNIHLNKSLEYLEKAARQSPQDGHIVDSLGWVLYKLGRYEAAIPPLEKAILYLPYDATINEHLGDAYWQVGRHREARFQWKRALNHLDQKAASDLKTRLHHKLVNGLKDDRVRAAETDI